MTETQKSITENEYPFKETKRNCNYHQFKLIQYDTLYNLDVLISIGYIIVLLTIQGKGNKIIERPRKTLEFNTPKETFNSLLLNIQFLR